MRIATVIICHQDPVAVERMIKAMAHPSVDFYLHLDKKVDIQPYAFLGVRRDTYFIHNRKMVRWGGLSQLEAMISSMNEILASGRSYDFINLLSGQDYPIKPAREMYAFLQQHSGKSFMTCEKAPTPWWDEAMTRFTEYHFIDYGFRGRFRLGKILSSLLPTRKFPLPHDLYGGPDAGYWIISMEAAQYICTALKRLSKYRVFFKHTWSPDEFLVSTLLMNSPLKATIIPENYHYMDRSLGGSHPKILTVSDFPDLLNSPKFFARKFDRAVDEEILNRIDNEILFVKNKLSRFK